MDEPDLLGARRARCDTCGGASFRPRLSFREHVLCEGNTHALTLGVATCERCGLDVLDPPPSTALLDWHYGNASKRPVRGARLDLRRDQVRFVREAVPAAGRAFEVGCFDGALLALLAHEGWEVGGCDLSEAGLRLAREEHGLEVQRGEFPALPLEDGSLDLVLAAHVLEHLERPSELLAAARARLRDGGHLFLAVPDVALAEPRPPFEFFAFPHLTSFSAVTLENLLRRYGFDPVARRRPEGFPFLEVVARRGALPAHFEPTSDFDASTARLEAYARERERRRERFRARWSEHRARWERAGARAVLWGAGLHTAMLVELLELAPGDVVGVVDGGDRAGGRQLGHRVLAAREVARLRPDVVLVSSFTSAADIGREVREQLGDSVELFYFHGGPTSGHPIAGEY